MSTHPTQTTPRLITSVAELRSLVTAARQGGQTVGLVPTMGALHAGHASLVDAAVRECDLTIVTIFVNPTQFGPHEDFQRYPRTLNADVQLLSQHGADVVFSPATEVMYPANHATSVLVSGVALPFEGQFRPHHFGGVATIVLKLFNLVQADRAYFGRKDFQQCLVVKQMVRDLDLPIHIEVCPTVRESDGLALSSRNAYLSADERRRALAISRSLKRAEQLVAAGTCSASEILVAIRGMLTEAELEIDYVALADPLSLAEVDEVSRETVALIAARVGKTRLIDNALIKP